MNDTNNNEFHDIWHPFTSQGLKQKVPIKIVRGTGPYLITESGQQIFDAISSWWVNLHGHSHPYMLEKISEQLKTLEHVIFAGFTHDGAINFTKRFLRYFNPKMGKTKIFFSDNGSTSVEVALKLSLQYWYNLNRPRKKILAFKNGYHGDTFGAMSVSGRGPFTGPFESLFFDVTYLDAPTPQNAKSSLLQMDRILKLQGRDIAAFIFEPLVQGTAGMVMQDPATLNELIKLAKQWGVLTIADEVMTGFYRTGKMFASDYLQEEVDIICVAKGITGGVMPLGATVVHQKIHEAFISDKQTHTFFHGHSYTANPVALSAALANLDLLEQVECQNNIRRIQKRHLDFVQELNETPSLKDKCEDIRALGTICAIELKVSGRPSYFHQMRDQIYDYFLEKNLLLRPLGNVFYLIPPYCTDDKLLDETYEAIKVFLHNLGPSK